VPTISSAPKHESPLTGELELRAYRERLSRFVCSADAIPSWDYLPELFTHCDDAEVDLESSTLVVSAYPMTDVHRLVDAVRAAYKVVCAVLGFGTSKRYDVFWSWHEFLTSPSVAPAVCCGRLAPRTRRESRPRGVRARHRETHRRSCPTRSWPDSEAPIQRGQ